MAQEDPKSIQLAYTHPTTAERFVRMEHSIQEIEAKRSRQLALQPELKAGRRDTPAESPTPWLAASGRPQPEPVSSMVTPPAGPESAAAAPAPVFTVEALPDSSAAGYVSETRSSEEPAEPMDEAIAANRWNALLLRSVDLRRATADVQRLRLLDDVREVRPGLLSAMVGPDFGSSSTEYNLGRLLAAYRSTVEWNPTATLILWKDDRQIGSFAGDHLTVSPER